METFGFFVPRELRPHLKLKLQKTFESAKIKVEFHQYAYLVTADGHQNGFFCEVCSPVQILMQQAAAIIKQEIGLDVEQTIPLTNAVSPSTGCVTKALHTEIDISDMRDFCEQILKIKSALKQVKAYTGIYATVLLLARPKDFKLIGFSPADSQTNPDVWQKYLGQELRKCGYTPRFSGSWTTSPEIYRRILAQAQKKN